ncbi:hypothetical protein [Streptomyces sp. NPDC059009]|uniref:hypothetical protein n=1 Tax=Streptomyces sp. NPDC059009 TaxID=3346694 RepID=UPI00367FB6EE
MTDRPTYIIEHPDGGTIEHTKGGKVPQWATWWFDPREDRWRHAGYSNLATIEEATKKALPDFRRQGARTVATRVLGVK